MPTLDLSRLACDLERSRRERPEGVGPGGRPVTGAMQVVRENLAALESLHAAGATWVEIAGGLSAQGVLQGDGKPLTGRRLTALIASVRRQQARREANTAKRLERPDLPALPKRKLALASDLVTQARPIPPAATEEDLRREQLASLQDLLKKD